MKKLFFTVVAASALLAGCAKNEDTPAFKDYDILFSVADKAPYGTDTKAVKQGWAKDDQIILVFDEDQGAWLDPENNDNTITLTYDGSEWSVTNADQDIVDDLYDAHSSEGWWTAIHYPGDVSFGTTQGNQAYFNTYDGGEWLMGEGGWSFEGEDLVLGEIVMKRDAAMFQVSVVNLAQDGGDWTMTIHDCEGNTNYVDINHLCDGVELYVDIESSGKVKYRNTVKESAAGKIIGNDVVFTFLFNDQEMKGCQFKLTNGSQTFTAPFPEQGLQGGKAYLLPYIDNDLVWIY